MLTLAENLLNPFRASGLRAVLNEHSHAVVPSVLDQARKIESVHRLLRQHVGNSIGGRFVMRTRGMSVKTDTGRSRRFPVMEIPPHIGVHSSLGTVQRE